MSKESQPPEVEEDPVDEIEQAIQELIRSGEVASFYYNAHGYLRALEGAGKKINNKRIESDAREALNHLDHIHDELEAKYKWD
jgi:hypothetical protein